MNDPCAPENVPVPPVMVAVPESEVAEVGVTVEEAERVLKSANLTTKETVNDPAPPPPPVTVMVVAPYGVIVPDPVSENVLTLPVPVPLKEKDIGVCALALFH